MPAYMVNRLVSVCIHGQPLSECLHTEWNLLVNACIQGQSLGECLLAGSKPLSECLHTWLNLFEWHLLNETDHAIIINGCPKPSSARHTLWHTLPLNQSQLTLTSHGPVKWPKCVTYIFRVWDCFMLIVLAVSQKQKGIIFLGTHIKQREKWTSRPLWFYVFSCE